MFFDEDFIHRYTRKQALADGVLVDVSETAREVGFRYPVALTRAVWERYVRVPEGVECQDEAGRLYDVLWMLRWRIQTSDGKFMLFFKLYVRNDNRRSQLIELKAVCGPDDEGLPCITIMLPGED